MFEIGMLLIHLVPTDGICQFQKVDVEFNTGLRGASWTCLLIGFTLGLLADSFLLSLALGCEN